MSWKMVVEEEWFLRGDQWDEKYGGVDGAGAGRGTESTARPEKSMAAARNAWLGVRIWTIGCENAAPYSRRLVPDVLRVMLRCSSGIEGHKGELCIMQIPPASAYTYPPKTTEVDRFQRRLSWLILVPATTIFHFMRHLIPTFFFS
jgi:hypothetical protein